MMGRIDNDALGDRMKQYEAVSTSRKAFKGQPLIARLDGKNFSTFTGGLTKPYHEGLIKLMQHLTRYLVEEYQATIGYTQSDEITLVFLSKTNDAGELLFDGRFQKLDSLLAADASVEFNSLIERYLPERNPQLGYTGKKPKFDCRTYIVPTVMEAYNTVLWRQLDATKNAISMAAQSCFSYKELHGKNGGEMKKMLLSKHGIDFDLDYPFHFKRGSFFSRQKMSMPLSEEQLAKMPAHLRATQENAEFVRSYTRCSDIDLLTQENPIVALFGDKVIKPIGE
jgi:tRNA(His) 5'-end guanylyltransferase